MATDLRWRMNVAIAKLGASGDVVRSTPVIRRLGGRITWVTLAKNTALLRDVDKDLICVPWEQRERICCPKFDLVINLEDTVEVGQFVKLLGAARIFGAYLGSDGNLRYSEESAPWFDLSLISRHGRKEADRLKLVNRQSYQELVFGGFGWNFTKSDAYLLPKPLGTDLRGDVAIAAEAGAVWPMKNWAYYGDLKRELEREGLTVNFLPKRDSLLEHLGDINNHRCLVGGDSLPMHLALGMGIPCVTLFNCTSPWEIYDYGIQTKIVSPLLEEFFYKRDFDSRATTAIALEEVLSAVMLRVGVPAVGK